MTSCLAFCAALMVLYATAINVEIHKLFLGEDLGIFVARAAMERYVG